MVYNILNDGLLYIILVLSMVYFILIKNNSHVNNIYFLHYMCLVFSSHMYLLKTISEHYITSQRTFCYDQKNKYIFLDGPNGHRLKKKTIIQVELIRLLDFKLTLLSSIDLIEITK